MKPLGNIRGKEACGDIGPGKGVIWTVGSSEMPGAGGAKTQLGTELM